MLHLSQRNRESCSFAEFTFALGGFGQRRLGNLLALRDAELLVERPNMVNSGFDPMVGHA